MARDIEEQHVRLWCRCDEKRGYGSELRNCVGNYVENQITIHGDIKYHGTLVTQRSVVHFLYVSVL